MFGRRDGTVHDEETEAVGSVRDLATSGETSEADRERRTLERPPAADYQPGPKGSAFFVLKRTVREFGDDQGTDLAAALTYYSVLALFPGLIALLSLVGLFGQAQNTVDTILSAVKPLVSSNLYGQIEGALASLTSAQGAGIGFAVGLLGALVSASGYVGAFSRAMNRIYEVEEGRPFWRMRPMQLVVTVITVVLCALALLILVVSGRVTSAVGNAIGVGSDVQQVWEIAKWPALGVVVIFVVALLYWATPNVRFPSFRLVSVGAFVAILVWLVASVGFAVYVVNYSSYNQTYGAVAGAVVVLLWLWLTNVALLFGAELDAELERGRELSIGLAAEERLQLPVRDTRGIEKADRRRAEDVAKQKEIRLAADGPGDPGDRPFGRR